MGLLLGLVVTGPGLVHAQTPGAPGREGPPGARPAMSPLVLDERLPPERPPSPREAMRAFNAVDSWVRGWSAPKEGEPGAEQGADGKPLPAAYGACIQLRMHGELIGRGVATADAASGGGRRGGGGGGLGVPSAALLARAAEQAIREADARLPVPNDLGRGGAVKELARDIQISLELAGAPIAVVGDTWEAVDQALSPGLDGVAARAEGAAIVIFPSLMMMRNTLPQRALRGAAAEALGEGGAAKVLEAPKDLREKSGLRMMRFRVTHLAQCGPGEGPVFLYRGSKLHTFQPDNAEGLRRELTTMGNGLVLNLTNRWSDAETKAPRFGIYEPWQNQFVEHSTNTQSLLIAIGAAFDYALDEHDRRIKSVAQLQDRVYEFFTRAAKHRKDYSFTTPMDLLLGGLARGRLVRADEEYCVVTCRGEGLALQSIKDAATGENPSWNIIARDNWWHYEKTKFVLLSPLEQSIALFISSKKNRDNASVGWSSRELRIVFSDRNPNALISLMPWLGWAEVNVANQRARINSRLDWEPVELDAKGEIPSSVALREMRAQVWKHQLNALDAGEDAQDMVGGISFTSGTGTSLPNWQCVRPLAFIATMLGDDRLTEPGERLQETAHLLQALRFLRQLQADESCGWMYPNPAAAVGGIRASTWDHTMPPDATSLTLLCVVEALKSIEHLAAAEAAKPAGAPAAK